MADKTTTYVLEGDTASLVKAVDAGGEALDKLGTSADKTTKKVDKTNTATKKAAKPDGGFSMLTLGAGALASGLLTLGAGLGKTIQKMADAQNELHDMAIKAGVTSKTMAGLQDAAEASGQKIEDLQKALSADQIKVFSEFADRFGKDTGPAAAEAARDWQLAMTNLKTVMEPFSKKLMVSATEKVEGFIAGVVALQTVAGGASVALYNLGQNFLAIGSSMARKEGQSWTEWLMQDMDEFKARFADLEDPAQRFVKDIDDIGAAVEGNVKAVLRLTAAQKKVLAQTSELVAGLEGKKVGIKDLTKEWGSLIKAIEAGAAALDVIAESNRFGLTEEDKLRDAYDKKIEQLAEIEIQTKKNLALIDKEIDKAKKNKLSTEELTEAQREGQLSLMRIDKERLASIEALNYGLEKLDDTQKDHLATVATVAKAYEDAFGAAIDFVLSQNEVLTNAQRNGLLVLYRLQQAAAITSIIIDTAKGIMKYAALGPAGIPGGVAIGALGATQVAMVAATPPPFHVGGIIPDGASLASVLPGESVLTREATAKLGTEGVRDLNSGMGSPTIVVEQIYKHKIFDSFVQDNINKGGPLASAIRGTSRVGRT